MPSEDYIEDFLKRVQNTIDQALTELMEVKMIRENDPTEFPYLQNELNELDQEMVSIIEDQDSIQRQRLLEAQSKLREVQEIMVQGI